MPDSLECDLRLEQEAIPQPREAIAYWEVCATLLLATSLPQFLKTRKNM